MRAREKVPIPPDCNIDDPRVCAEELQTAQANIQKHYRAIQEMLCDAGFSNTPEEIQMKIGPEIEFTQIGDFQSFATRLSQVLHEANAHQQSGEEPIYDFNRKTQDHVPLAARYYELDKLIVPPLIMMMTADYYHAFNAAYSAYQASGGSQSRDDFQREHIIGLIEEVEPNFRTDMAKAVKRAMNDLPVHIKQDVVKLAREEYKYEERCIAHYLATNLEKSPKFEEYFSRSRKRARFEPEPSFNMNAYTDPKLIAQHSTRALLPKLVSSNQVEISYDPMPPDRIAPLLCKLTDRLIHGDPKVSDHHGAKQIGMESLDMRSNSHSESAPNSIHLNCGLTINGRNALNLREWGVAEERYISRESVTGPVALPVGSEMGKPSELARHIALAHKVMLPNWLYLFARTDNDFERLKETEPSGPSFIGMADRKEHGRFCTAMFRGEGKLTERLTSANPNKPDKGDFRFEFRLPGLGAMGHPNKTAYPEQKLLAYEMMEAYMYMLRRGVESYVETMKERRKGNILPRITDEMLAPRFERYEDNSGERALDRIKDQKGLALSDFVRSADIREYYGEKRMKILILLGDRLDLLNREDHHPEQETGPHISRLQGEYGEGLLRDYQGYWINYYDHFSNHSSGKSSGFVI